MLRLQPLAQRFQPVAPPRHQHQVILVTRQALDKGRAQAR